MSVVWPDTKCCIQVGECICGQDERALRGYMRGDHKEPMTPDQREWCLNEIGQVEGYDRADYEGSSDADLATGVLFAWQDYCRDKGLL